MSDPHGPRPPPTPAASPSAPSSAPPSSGTTSLAFPLLGVALWLRRRVEESPLFDRLLAEDARASAPVRDVVVRAWPALLVGAGSALLGVGGFYLATTFVISYATRSGCS